MSGPPLDSGPNTRSTHRVTKPASSSRFERDAEDFVDAAVTCVISRSCRSPTLNASVEWSGLFKLLSGSSQMRVGDVVEDQNAASVQLKVSRNLRVLKPMRYDTKRPQNTATLRLPVNNKPSSGACMSPVTTPSPIWPSCSPFPGPRCTGRWSEIHHSVGHRRSAWRPPQ